MSALGPLLKLLGNKGPLGKFASLSASVGQLSQVGSQIEGLAGKAVQSVNPLHKLSNAIGTVGNAVSGSIGLITEPARALIGSFGQVRESIVAVGNGAAQFTAALNPMYAKLQEFAATDLTAALGKMLIPLQQFGTALTRGFADVFNKIAGPVRAAFGRLLDPITRDIPKLVDALGPLLRVGGKFVEMIGTLLGQFSKFGEGNAFDTMESLFEILEENLTPVFEVFTAVIEVLGDKLAAAARSVTEFLRSIGLISGPSGPRERIAGSSTGIGVRNASIGSQDSFLQKAWVNAFMMGSSAARPEERSANSLDAIKIAVNKILEDIQSAPMRFAVAVAEAITPSWAGGDKGTPGVTAGAAGGIGMGAGDLGGRLLDRIRAERP